MPVFTARFTTMFEILTGDQWGLGGRTDTLKVANAKLVGADRRNGQIYTLSAGLSAYALTLAPLGVSAPALISILWADNPVDLRTNAPTDTVFLSGVQVFCFTGHLSALYVTTGSAITTLAHECVGGSNATLTASLPLP
jgi:hypothetical protein